MIKKRKRVSAEEKYKLSVKSYMGQVQKIYGVIRELFGDDLKTITWITTPNPMLGGVSPVSMIRCGRFKKLWKIVNVCLDENRRSK